MENFKDTIETVVSAQLLASSLSELAEKLGYKGRSTLYRIIRGKGKRAIAGLRQKLSEELFVDDDTLDRMAVTVENATLLHRSLKDCMKPNGALSTDDVIQAFVANKFDIFPEAFCENELNGLLTFERTSPDEYYDMLAYFYYKYSDVEYYTKGESHRERCARVLETLGEKFIDQYPENDLGAYTVYSYSESDIYNGESPMLWSLIETISTLLRFYSRPIEALQSVREIRFLDFLHKRDYWTASDKQYVILTCAVTDINAGSGHYEIFKIDRTSKHIEHVGVLNFLSDSIVSLTQVFKYNCQLGVYGYDGSVLSFEWEKPDDEPMTVGNKWTALDKSQSQSLREIDAYATDDRLYAAKLKCEGMKEVPGYTVEDVIISRETLSLRLKNGKTLSISLLEAPFLQKIRPADTVMILRRVDNDVALVNWPNIKHCLPLDRFTESDN